MEQNTTQHEPSIYERFISAQAAFAMVGKTKSMQAFGRGQSYQYADINGVLEIVRPELNRHGLGLMQLVTNSSDSSLITITTRIFDGHGEQINSEPMTVSTAGLTQKGVQALGSAITYVKRYQLVAMLGLALGERDDDGAAAVAAVTGQQVPAEPRDVTQAPAVDRDMIRSTAETVAQEGREALRAWMKSLQPAERSVITKDADMVAKLNAIANANGAQQ